MTDINFKPGDLVCLRPGQSKYNAIKIANNRSWFDLYPKDIGMYLGEFRELRSIYDNEIISYDIILFEENRLELSKGVLVKAKKNNE